MERYHSSYRILLKFNVGAAGWGDAATICPWTIYLMFRDKRILENQYNSMKAWVEYITTQTNNKFLWNTGYQFGDWLSLGEKTPGNYIATAYYAYSTIIVMKTAMVLEQKKGCRNLFEIISKYC